MSFAENALNQLDNLLGIKDKNSDDLDFFKEQLNNKIDIINNSSNNLLNDIINDNKKSIDEQ